MMQQMLVGLGGASLSIDEVFSTKIYTGNSNTSGTGPGQSINNGLDLAGEGGLVWTKRRTPDHYSHMLFDTKRGVTKYIQTNGATQQGTSGTDFSSFNSNGYTLGPYQTLGTQLNYTGVGYVSWSFRKAPGFFDLISYTGNGQNGRNINHDLGSVPGMIISKRLDASENWGVWHRSLGTSGLYLNANNSAGVTGVPNNHTSTTFEVSSGYGLDNTNGATYIAYVFAHEDMIKCGSYVGAVGRNVNLGFEPQLVIAKKSSGAGHWAVSYTHLTLPTNREV